MQKIIRTYGAIKTFQKGQPAWGYHINGYRTHGHYKTYKGAIRAAFRTTSAAYPHKSRDSRGQPYNNELIHVDHWERSTPGIAEAREGYIWK
jgi:hypothetical protein